MLFVARCVLFVVCCLVLVEPCVLLLLVGVCNVVFVVFVRRVLCVCAWCVVCR